ncbi:SURF1 family protein [Herbaspirillum sp. LeCh32-8]|uniref:SURF1 family protein n=1 Tax=Herbaspirillum sp. LeCh32-8 TaxID=2821356 RepID=UPI001AE5182E|nr:SURF1 family protein [Herbaspirillum sp. LeCh32-8]MBP0597407.1 SURF1 family protein [Herbaspirillum sp. LeCh32-8]
MSPTPPNGVMQDTQGKENGAAQAVPTSRSKASLVFLAICAGFFFVVFIALGTWQVYRLQWKLALIAKVDARVHAAAVAAPGHDQWPQVSSDSDEYRRVTLSGRYLYSKTTAVQASTDLGSGSWLLTPLQTAGGDIVMINRGFVSTSPIKLIASTAANGSAEQVVEVTGLMRMSEQGGGFLRSNDAGQNRWYSRDVAQIAAARELKAETVAPYFIDADRASSQANAATAPDAEKPVGGLTVIAFHNSHLVYALTWYALALMAAAAGWWVVRDERRRRARGAAAAE